MRSQNGPWPHAVELSSDESINRQKCHFIGSVDLKKWSLLIVPGAELTYVVECV